MTRSTDRAAAGLELILAPDLDPAVAEICVHERHAMGHALSRWGRFLRPVTVRTTEDRSALRHAAKATSAVLLCGLADLDSVTLLAPHRWLSAPAHHDLRDVLVHELAHVLLFQRCTPADRSTYAVLPMWMREGQASFAAEGPPSPNLRRTVAGYTNLAALVAANATALAAHGAACYTVATLVFAGWLECFGDRRLAALCGQMRRGLSFNQAHQRACGVDVASFEASWVASVIAESKTR